MTTLLELEQETMAEIHSLPERIAERNGNDVCTIYHRGGQQSVATVTADDLEMERCRLEDLDINDSITNTQDYVESVVGYPAEKTGWKWIGDTLIHTAAISGIKVGASA